VDSSIGPSTFYKDITSGLVTGLAYRFKVIVKNTAGEKVGNVVSSVIADTPDTPSGAPTVVLDETNTTHLTVNMAQVAGNGGSAIISYHLQRTESDGSGFFDVEGGDSNYTLATTHTIGGLHRGMTYRFRYRARNSVGWSDWSPIAYLFPASVPTAPPTPVYVSSTNS